MRIGRWSELRIVNVCQLVEVTKAGNANEIFAERWGESPSSGFHSLKHLLCPIVFYLESRLIFGRSFLVGI